MSAGYQEQYDRLKRWYSRFQALDAGREHNVFSDNYVDDIYAFFLNCYHPKDWIKNDKTLSPTIRHAVEGYVKSNACLELCADICNSLKHLELDRPPRTGSTPTFENKAYALTVGVGSPVISLKYRINTAQGPKDAFELATECTGSWDAFLASRGLV